MNIKEIAGQKNLFESFLKDCRRREMPLLLYGAGSYCDWGLRLLKRYDIAPIYIVDKRRGGGKK